MAFVSEYPFWNLLQLLNHNFGEMTRKEATSIIRVIKTENGGNLQNMTEDKFLEKAKYVEANKIHEEPPFCTICFQGFESRNNLDLHIANIHKEDAGKRISCKFCGKSYMTTISLKYHIDTCHSETSPKVKCEVCDIEFSHSTTLKRHMKTHDKNPITFKCFECQKVFARKDKLTSHKNSVHRIVNKNLHMIPKLLKKDSKSFQCNVCDKVFEGSDAELTLQLHVSSKCDTQRFKCNKCGKHFSRNDNLIQHMKNVHTHANKILSCEHCDFTTRYKSNLAKHMNIHKKTKQNIECKKNEEKIKIKENNFIEEDQKSQDKDYEDDTSEEEEDDCL